MQKVKKRVVLMLGGNMGDTRLFFAKAIRKVEKLVGPVQIKSSLYSSSPWGFTDQRNFLNQALVVNSKLDPAKLLEATSKIEKSLGKKTVLNNGPRTIDIDIIFYNDLIVNKPDLEIPHPRMHLRKFNLLPLDEIIPDYIHPRLKENISSLLKKCHDPLTVTRLDEY